MRHRVLWTFLAGLLAVGANIVGCEELSPDLYSFGKQGPAFDLSCRQHRFGAPFAWRREVVPADNPGEITDRWGIIRVRGIQSITLGVNIAAVLVGVIVVQKVLLGGLPRARLLLLAAGAGVGLLLSRAAWRDYGLGRSQEVCVARMDGVMEVEWSHSRLMVANWPVWRSPTWPRRIQRIVLEDASLLTQIPGREEIEVLRVLSVGEGDVHGLVALRYLRALDISSVNYKYTDDTSETRVRRAFSMTIGNMQDLEGVNVRDAGMTDGDVAAIARVAGLRTLDISSNPDVTDRVLVHLVGLKGLRKLGVSGTALSSAGVQTLKTALPQCEID